MKALSANTQPITAEPATAAGARFAARHGDSSARLCKDIAEGIPQRQSTESLKLLSLVSQRERMLQLDIIPRVFDL